MIDYFKYDVSDENSHLNTEKECPKCGSNISNQKFCETCGLYLLNECTGLPETAFYSRGNYGEFRNFALIDSKNNNTEINSKDFTHHFSGCDYPQSGKARYCAKCGCVTTFYIQGMLEAWDDEKREILSTRKSVADSDMPF